MKFSIRDLFLMTAIVALAVGWWVDRGRQAIELEMVEWKLDALTGLIEARAGYKVTFNEDEIELAEPDSDFSYLVKKSP